MVDNISISRELYNKILGYLKAECAGKSHIYTPDLIKQIMNEGETEMNDEPNFDLDNPIYSWVEEQAHLYKHIDTLETALKKLFNGLIYDYNKKGLNKKTDGEWIKFYAGLLSPLFELKRKR